GGGVTVIRSLASALLCAVAVLYAMPAMAQHPPAPPAPPTPPPSELPPVPPAQPVPPVPPTPPPMPAERGHGFGHGHGGDHRSSARVSVKGPVALRLEVFAGDIEVIPGAADHVTVTVSGALGSQGIRLQ